MERRLRQRQLASLGVLGKVGGYGPVDLPLVCWPSRDDWVGVVGCFVAFLEDCIG
ncbi:hypothetical protein ACFLTY_01260 [Chloroflexota bacterium]